MKYISLPHFERKFEDCSKEDQQLIYETIVAIKAYLESSTASYGLRVKRLYAKIYEARMDIRLRIAFFRDKDVVKFFCLGNHEDIARCLKRLQSIQM